MRCYHLQTRRKEACMEFGRAASSAPSREFRKVLPRAGTRLSFGCGKVLATTGDLEGKDLVSVVCDRDGRMTEAPSA